MPLCAPGGQPLAVTLFERLDLVCDEAVLYARPIGEVAYLMLDARYEKVRINGSVVSCAVLVATGVLADGKRSVLGVALLFEGKLPDFDSCLNKPAE